jgi:DNA repair protein RecO (recombination protein O)
MPTEKATAIVLRVISFSETSSIVTLLTREFGKIRGLAKGARRIKGPFESALDLLAVCHLVFLRKSSDALDLLTEAKLVRRFRPAKNDLAALYAAYYVAELLNELTDDYDPHPELFDLADRTLADLAAGQDVSVRLLRFELLALRLLGHLPSLDVCVECGRKVVARGRVAFGQLNGGVMCPPCRIGKKQVVSVSAQGIESMRRFAAVDSQDWENIDLDRSVRGELRGILNHYLNHLLGHKLRTQEYLGTYGR